MIKKQSTLFPEKELKIFAELSLDDAQKLASQIKAFVKMQCDRIEIAGSIRRQKSVVHDLDFVAVPKSDGDWLRISEILKLLKARPICTGNQLIKAYVPFQSGLFQADFYRAKPATYGIHLLIRTGSAEQNCWLAGCAISQRMRLKYSEGLIKEGRAIAGEDERGVFAALGLPYPLPPEREIVDSKPVWINDSN